MKKPSILLIYTGGTIGMVHDPKSGALHPFNFDHLSQEIPELKEFQLNLESYAFDPLMDSSNMNPSAWVKIAGLIEERYENYDGFVILHGTDTMAYTASALSFMFENLGKPVILTGSQLPIGMIRTDGKENVITAIEIAAAQKNSDPLVPEVCIYFENELFRGNRTHKFNAEHFEAFKSVNYPPLAEAGVHIKYNTTAIQPISDQEFRVFRKLDDNIAVLRLFPGISKQYVESILGIPGLKAVILESYGTGNAPGDDGFTEALQKAIEADIVIFNITQCRGGAVEMGKYASSYNLKKIGVVGGGDITVEAAVTKLMYLLGNGYGPQKVKKYLKLSLRGEMTR